MRTYKDIGITFKQKELNEADKIISILTKYNGRVDAIAKGIRKITSKKAGNIDLIALSNFSFAKGKNLDIVTEVELINNFSKLKNKLESTFTLFYICELLDNLLKAGERQKETFDLLMNLLLSLHINNHKLSVRAFELKLMKQHGFEPNLKTCLNCDKRLKQNEKRYLSFHQLGFICNKEKETKGTLVSDKSLKVLNFLIKKDIKESHKIKTTKKLDNEIQRITQNWLEMIFEKRLKSEKFI